MVAAAIRTIFAQPTGAEVIEQLGKVAAMLAAKLPALAAMLTDAKEDLTAFASFPTSHWVKIWSTNPLERVNKRSSAGRMWSASSPTTQPCCGWPGRC
jgi:putative transposase